MQKTIAKPVAIEGVGLHSGKAIHMRLLPAEVGHGIVFHRTDCNPAVAIPVAATRVNDTRLATTINEGPVYISTIEHLMSALCGLAIDNLDVEVDAPETPILDGSGLDYVALVESAGIVEQDAPRRYVKVLKTVEVLEGDKFAKLEPEDGFSMEFTIGFGNAAIDRTEQHASVDFAKQSYREALGYARTFCLRRDIEALRSMGLAQGGSLENAVVVDEDKILNPEGLRANDEFVKHKMLDALGDLYVLGAPMLAHYSAGKSGHALNNKLLRALLADDSAWEWVER